ncbi:LysR family transcriptional regulator [Acidovorax sp. 69]|uniref:LysR family transcriptional regulator n=1 Tax=Acidovorax sp. 69 TaxID=2035202 RepID=UPI000C2338B3|nr:LysR family transcriptional regulator [Acidovorax sp. 69]PJI95826.1 LysR family transcriptional regulator [Acidovorax sp. 69]
MQTILDAKWHLFAKVAELGSLSRASAALDMPQSVVSRHIAQLETESGSRLFRRTGRGVVLTELGERVYPRIKAMIRQAEQLADDIRSSRGIPMGEVRLGLLPSTVGLLAGRLYAKALEQFPEVQLHITEGSSAQLEEWLKEGRLDLAFLLREEDSARKDEPVLTRLRLVLIVPLTHELAGRRSIPFEDVLKMPLVLPSDPHPFRARIAALARQHGAVLRIGAEADSIHLQHEIAAHGGGFAITAGQLTPLERKRLATVKIVQPVFSRSIVLGTTLHRPSTHASREIARLVLEWVPDLLKSQDPI